MSDQQHQQQQQQPLPTLAITGSTGLLGGAVARALAAKGVAQRLLVRTVAKAPVLANAVVFPCSYANRDAAIHALTGVHTLLMVSAAENKDRLAEHRAFVDSAKAAGVKHVVYTSIVQASASSIFTLARDHYFTEEHIKAAGLTHTFLRDNFYADFMPALVGEDNVIRGPAGEGRAAIVARADVARTITAVLENASAHTNVTYNMTGPEALSMKDVAETLSRALKKPVVFHDETLAEAYESRKKWAAEDWQNDAWVSTYTAIAAGEFANVSRDIETITGSPPKTLTELLAS